MKKRIKQLLFINLILFACLFFNTNIYAEELSPAQGEAIARFATKFVETYNQKGLLRYSQYGTARVQGYKFQKSTSSGTGSWTPKSGRLYITLTEKYANLLTNELRLKGDEDTVVKPAKYSCQYRSQDLKGKLCLDCSSFVSAMYNWTIGAKLDDNGWPWSTGTFMSNQSYFKTISRSELRPGDAIVMRSGSHGHIVLVIGGTRNPGKNEYVHASGENPGKSGTEDSIEAKELALYQFLSQHNEYIYELSGTRKMEPVLDLNVRHKPGNRQLRFDNMPAFRDSGNVRCLRYIGPIGQGTHADLTALGDAGATSDPNAVPSPDGNVNTNTSNSTPFVFPDGAVTWPERLDLKTQKLATSSKYFYKGTPTYGEYVGKVQPYNWFIADFPEVIDWLIGFTTYAMKAVAIGWVSIMENLTAGILNYGVKDTSQPIGVNSEKVLNKVSDIENAQAFNEENFENRGELTPIAVLANNDSSKNVDPITGAEIKKKMTVEDILFNRVPILDVNFFNFEEAGGQKLETGSLLYKIRQTIAAWYNVIRLIVIMGMLCALIYVAIRIAISTPTARAEYKEKLKDWLVGFIIVFSIHYFMIIVIQLNYQVVKVLDPVAQASTTVQIDAQGRTTNFESKDNGETSLYEAIRVQAHDVKATTGISATIIYFVLVLLMIRFLILYAKRLFVIAVLTVFSPVMGLLYSINKGKYQMKDWMVEYVYNVFIQLIDVVIYTAVVGLAFDISKSSTFLGGILAIITLSFLISAEKLVSKIFGMNKSKYSSNLANSALNSLAGVAIAKSAYGLFNKYSNKDNKDKEQNKKVNRNIQGYAPKFDSRVTLSDWENRYAPPKKEYDEKGKLINPESEEEARERRGKRVLDSKNFKPNTKKFNGRDYIVDKDGIPLTVYDPGIDPERKNYFTISSIDNVIADQLEEEKRARKDFAKQTLTDIRNAVVGSFSLLGAIPMLVLSPAYGIGMGAAGIHMLASASKIRKIEGARSGSTFVSSSKSNKSDSNNKKDEEENDDIKKEEKEENDVPKKWTSKKLKFAYANKIARYALKMSTLGYINVGESIYKNAKNADIYLVTTEEEEKELLYEVRKLEDKLARIMVNMELMNKSNNPYKSIDRITSDLKDIAIAGPYSSLDTASQIQAAEKRLKEATRNIEEDEFDKALKKTLREVEVEDIEKIVNKQRFSKGNKKVDKVDIEEISSLIRKKYNRDLDISQNLSDIVREELKEQIIKVGNYKVIDEKNIEEHNELIKNSEIKDNKQFKIVSEKEQVAESLRQKYNRDPKDVEKNNLDKQNDYRSNNLEVKDDKNIESIDETQKVIELLRRKNNGEPENIGKIDTDIQSNDSINNLEAKDYKKHKIVDEAEQVTEMLRQKVNRDSENELDFKFEDTKQNTYANLRTDKSRETNLSSSRFILKKELDTKVDNVLSEMNNAQLIDLFDQTLKRKEAVNREVTNPQFREMMQVVREYKDKLDEYKELKGHDMLAKYEPTEDRKAWQVKKDSKGHVEYYSLEEVVREMRTFTIGKINNENY